MDAPNFSQSFTADIVAYFSRHGWSTNVVETRYLLGGSPTQL